MTTAEFSSNERCYAAGEKIETGATDQGWRVQWECHRK